MDFDSMKCPLHHSNSSQIVGLECKYASKYNFSVQKIRLFTTVYFPDEFCKKIHRQFMNFRGSASVRNFVIG